MGGEDGEQLDIILLRLEPALHPKKAQPRCPDAEGPGKEVPPACTRPLGWAVWPGASQPWPH